MTYKVEEKLPNQKDLVLVEVKGVVMPAIYYRSLRNGGFYHFSLFYHQHEKNTYSKVRIKEKFEIKNVEKWCLMPNSL